MPANSWISNLADAFVNNALSALGAGGRALENPGEFLRDDLPDGTDGLTLWIQDRNRRACRRHARNEAAGLYSNLGALRRPRYGHCKPYLDSINEGPTSSGSYGPPFTGGQCPIAYNIAYSGVAISNPNAQGQGGGAVFNFVGQSQGFNKYPVGPILGIKIGTSIQADCGQSNGLQIHVVTAGGIVGFGCFDPPHQPSVYVPKSVQFTSITPSNSQQQDSCGNPPNQYNPPTWPPNLPSLPPPTVAPPGGDGGDDIEVDPDGNWRFCENGDCTPWFTPGGGGAPGYPGGEEDGDPQETNPDDPDDPNEISGCVEDGNVLVGLKIGVIEHPITYDGNDSIYYRVGWIWMGPNENQLDLTVDGATIRDGQFVFPDSPDCSCYTVRANPGFRLSVQAFSRPREENQNN